MLKTSLLILFLVSTLFLTYCSSNTGNVDENLIVEFEYEEYTYFPNISDSSYQEEGCRGTMRFYIGDSVALFNEGTPDLNDVLYFDKKPIVTTLGGTTFFFKNKKGNNIELQLIESLFSDNIHAYIRLNELEVYSIKINAIHEKKNEDKEGHQG